MKRSEDDEEGEFDVNTRHIRYILGVMEEQSFGRAAARLGVSQPAVSRKVKLLEDALGLTLLRRRPRQTELTEEGRALMKPFSELVERAAEVGEIVRQFQVQHSRPLRVGIMTVAYPERAALLGAFEAAYPQAQVEVDTGYTRALLHGLREDHYDVIMIVSPPPGAGLEYLVLRWFPVQIAINAESSLADLPVLPATALAGEVLGCFEQIRDLPLFGDLVAQLEAAGARLVCPDDQSRLGLLVYAKDHDAGVLCVFDEYSREEMTRAGMVLRTIDGVDPAAALVLLRMARHDHAASDRFWSFAENWVQSHMGLS